MDFEDHESMETKIVHLRTHHGYDFAVNLYNSESVSHFGCPNWEALCKMYDFQEGMLVTMDLGDPTSRKTIWYNALGNERRSYHHRRSNIYTT